MTVDPVENRGFEYHTGISFTFFAGGVATHGPVGDLGRGGRYDAGDPAAPEPATGFTLYTDTILRTLLQAASPRRLLLPLGVDRARGHALREAGWITVAALDPAKDWRAEARRLGCGHVLEMASRWPSAKRSAKWATSSWSAPNGVTRASKIVDWLSERADVVVRFQGGHNAGHTLVIGNVEYKLSLLPSGWCGPASCRSSAMGSWSIHGR